MAGGGTTRYFVMSTPSSGRPVTVIRLHHERGVDLTCHVWRHGEWVENDYYAELVLSGDPCLDEVDPDEARAVTASLPGKRLP